jgi:hypothetical protein
LAMKPTIRRMRPRIITEGLLGASWEARLPRPA